LGEAKWRELLREFDASSDTIDGFCKRVGVAESTFQRWRSRLAAGTTRPPSSASSKRMAQASPAGFLDLGALSLPSAGAGRLELTLDLGGGVTLRVARG